MRAGPGEIMVGTCELAADVRVWLAGRRWSTR